MPRTQETGFPTENGLMKEAHAVRRGKVLVTTLLFRANTLNRSGIHSHWRDTPPAAVFDPDAVRILVAAYKEAFLFLSEEAGVTRRGLPLDIARSIISHARRGLLDARRLALKAIVEVG